MLQQQSASLHAQHHACSLLPSINLLAPAALAGYYVWHMISQRGTVLGETCATTRARYKQALVQVLTVLQGQHTQLHTEQLQLLQAGRQQRRRQQQQQPPQEGAGGVSSSGMSSGSSGSLAASPADVPPLQLFHVASKHYRGELLLEVCGELGIQVLE
jgi:hypothetical protein